MPDREKWVGLLSSVLFTFTKVLELERKKSLRTSMLINTSASPVAIRGIDNKF